MFNLDDCVACITSKAAKTLGQRIEKKINEKYNVTRVQWMALYYINILEHPTQKELADRMALTEATVVRLIDRMEKEELVMRTHHSDKRKKYLELTDKGALLNNEASLIVEEFKDVAIKNISNEDLDTYKRVLDQMLKNTEED